LKGAFLAATFSPESVTSGDETNKEGTDEQKSKREKKDNETSGLF